MSDDFNTDPESFLDDFDDTYETSSKEPLEAEAPKKSLSLEFEGLDVFQSNSKLQSQGAGAFKLHPDELVKPWMKHHKFVLVHTIEEVTDLIDRILQHGRCSLDLETEGLDNRIEYDSAGQPYTVHKIAGFCIGLKGVGYYLPINHQYDPDMGEKNPNLPLEATKAEIRRLCLASQPVLTPEGYAEDRFASKKIAVHPQVVIFFWNAKFDQEFLYPLTGIDFWHPDSFEDGMLAAYCDYTDDELGLKEHAARRLSIRETSSDTPIPYEMIELPQLFPKGTKGREINFCRLYPEDGSPIVSYACSDSICTEILCETKGVEWDYKLPGLAQYSNTVEPLKKGLYDQHNVYRLEKQVTQAVRVMERARTQLDLKSIQELKAEAEAELEKYSKKIKALAATKGLLDLNPGSPEQISDFLFGPDGLNLPDKPDKTADATRNQYSTAADALEKIFERNPEVEVLDWVIKYRKIDKIIGTYLEGLGTTCDSKGQARFNFKQTGTQTARFTAPAGKPDHGYTKIPIHGIPVKNDPKAPEVAHSLRRLFISRDRYVIVKADYSSQELRVITNVSEEPLWLKEFKEGSGDLHTLTAKAFFGEHITKNDKLERNMGKCVHPNTLVVVDGVLKPIKKLGPKPRKGDFQPIVGQVFDGTGQKSLKALYYDGVRPMVHVVSKSGILTCTASHRLQMRDGTFKPAGDLVKGDLLAIPESIGLSSKPPKASKFSLWDGIPSSTYQRSNDLAYFGGLFAGDGTGNPSSASLIHGAEEIIDAYGNPYFDWIATMKDACTRCGFSVSPKGFDSLYLGSRVFVKLLRKLGLMRKRQKNLEVPTWVLEAGPETILHYFAGLVDTDGSVNKYGSLEWTTKSFVFAGQVAAALKICGLTTSVELIFNKKYQRYYARLHLDKAASFKLSSYMRHAGKKGRLKAPKPNWVGRPIDRFAIQAVLPASNDKCLDISVDSDQHIYWANGIVTQLTANFALAYGGGVQAIMRATKCNKTEAARRKEAFDKSVPVFATWLKGQHASVKQRLGVINAFGRFIKIPDANIKPEDVDKDKPEEKRRPFAEREKDARRIKAGCERKSVNFPIQSAGADVMKIALIKLVKEFSVRGWLKNGGDDSVRILLTVHDELVFEIKFERLMTAMPVIINLMESPAKIISKWKVPLPIDASVGLTWAAKVDWKEMMAGEIPIPDWLAAYVTLGEHTPTSEGVPKALGGETVAATQPKIEAPPPPSSPQEPFRVPLKRSNPNQHMIATFTVVRGCLPPRSIDLVRHAIVEASPAAAFDPTVGVVLRLVDQKGNVLVDPKLQIKIVPELFAKTVRDSALGCANAWVLSEEDL